MTADFIMGHDWPSPSWEEAASPDSSQFSIYTLGLRVGHWVCGVGQPVSQELSAPGKGGLSSKDAQIPVAFPLKSLGASRRRWDSRREKPPQASLRLVASGT